MHKKGLLFLVVFANVSSKDFSKVAIEDVKTFWNRRPCNIRHSAKPFGTKEYFDEIEAKKYFVEPHIPVFAEFERWKNKEVLEIGCGIGTDSINFARNGAKLTVLELSEESLMVTEQRFKVYNLNANFIRGNAEDLDMLLPENRKFDLIWAFGVIHHSPNPKVILEKCKKYLKDDGELRIMIYSKCSYKLFSIMRESGLWDFKAIDELMSCYSEAQTGCPITYTYTIDEARELLSDFSILDIRKAHIFPWKVEKYIKHEYEKEECFQDVDESLFKSLESEIGWHILIKAKPINHF